MEPTINYKLYSLAQALNDPEHPLQKPHGIQNEWLKLARNPWVLILKNLPFNDIVRVYQVCKALQEISASTFVSSRFMVPEQVEYMPGKTWFEAFGRRVVLLCLDRSGSMNVSTEAWREDVAVKKVKELVKYYRNSALSNKVVLMLFANNPLFIRINSCDQIDRVLNTIKSDEANRTVSPELLSRWQGNDDVCSLVESENVENTFPLLSTGTGNDWEGTFDSIHDFINRRGKKKAIVHLISDCEWSNQRNNKLWNTAFKITPEIHLWRIGNSPLGKTVFSEICAVETNVLSVEPVTKKSKNEPKIMAPYSAMQLTLVHIPSVDGTNDVEPSLSRAPTVFTEEVANLFGPIPVEEAEGMDIDEDMEEMDDFDDGMEEEDDLIQHYAVYDDPNDADYVDHYSYSGSED